jgi:hypothetical protein
LNLLEHFGYTQNRKGEYIYTAPYSNDETEDRQNAANEFQRFYIDLKKAKEDKLNGFDSFLKVNIYILFYLNVFSKFRIRINVQLRMMMMMMIIVSFF